MKTFTCSFLDSLSKNQVSSLKSYLKIFAKKHSGLSVNDLFCGFLEEQIYLKNIFQPKIPWIYDFLDSKDFKFFAENIFQNFKINQKNKEKNKILYEKQKAVLKKQRESARFWRQSHEKPTKKQLLYYNSLCQKYNIQVEDIANKSKLDLKNMISAILEKESS